MSDWLRPRPFFAGLATGLGLLCSAGYLSTTVNTFGDLVRFHPFVEGETLFNPTALEVRSLIEALPRNRTIVVVGGTSRFYGTGQTPTGIWTRHLQDHLGPSYAVINLALRSGRPDQFGEHAAEMLIRSGRNVVFVADTFFENFTPTGLFALYRYFFFDAAARGLLIDPAERLDAASLAVDDDPRQSFTELRLRSELNRLLFFEDLWTFIGYRFAFLPAWTTLTKARPFAARMAFTDPEQTVPREGYFSSLPKDKVMAALRGGIKPLIDDVVASVKTLPDAVRQRTILVTIRSPPLYVSEFTDEERGIYERNFVRLNAGLKSENITTIDLGADWTDADFVDAIHPSETGGKKLASELAPLVKALARRQGYDPN